MIDLTASKPNERSRSLRTPTIGVALGGGVARGWAHIGALKRLDALGIKPDIVAGTSVGALAGGFWLADRLPELEAWALSLTKRRMLNYFDVMVNGSGLMGGKRLRESLRQNLGDRKIESLPARFAAVTAELSTGHEIWLMEGALADAIEASYALPGVFPPRLHDGRWLIDGAMVNPLPVSVCRAFGARVVIAIGLHAETFRRAAAHRREKYEVVDATSAAAVSEAVTSPVRSAFMRRLFGAGGSSPQQAPGLGSVMMASFNIFMDRITRSRLAGDPPDVLIMPDVAEFGLLDFDKAKELIEAGAAAVDRHAASIESAIDSLA